ncbi:hypothetical protein IM676_17540 [Anabaenopsis elenkinii CCIBt3563]|uniref:Uncharacterized protein n=1 Tax=Anabaenopsis elenkinii CCIBt3563 TaxID=2779889 RepID=A0A7S6RCJ3_9CYAN|nr:hypothetical protein IM676_17540 [Anabaenopsis elenkinii CCIBt3563]
MALIGINLLCSELQWWNRLTDISLRMGDGLWCRPIPGWCDPVVTRLLE